MPSAFHVVAKPSGASCNLACGYCFYLPKSRLFAPGAALRMSGAVLEAYVRQHIEAQPVPHVVFTWQGGEPTLMGIDFFARALELQRRYQRAGMTIENAFQTNGVLLDEQWCAFLKANGFLVG
ncbi:MAG: anaerobic sulfatase maturase, partial [Betaproteobacteria bacterium]|nr:anaerobic sulfatase maturase [Betaproteobacteria bacterium]